MKQILNWQDATRNIKNTVYELDSGAKIVESINPGSIETYVSFAFSGGYIFENSTKLTKGTLHFLEHIMAGNPNKVFKDKKSFDNFVNGNLDQPKLFRNALTNRRAVRFVGSSHYKGLPRLLKYITAQIDYPLDQIGKYIEKERQVILSELLYKEKKETSVSIAYEEFFFKDAYDLVSDYGIGSQETINQISIEDLTECYDEVINSKNLIVSVQNPKRLNKKELKIIEDLANKLNQGEHIDFKPNEIKNGFKYRAFQKNDNNGIFLSINRFVPARKEVDYTENVLNYFYKKVISELTMKHIREVKKLIYEGGASVYPTIFSYLNHSFSSRVSIEKLSEFLEEAYIMFESGIEEFLKSEESDEWFESEKSTYIYRYNQNYFPEYAEDIAISIHSSVNPIYHFNEAVEVAKNINKEMILNYFKEIMKIEPGFWFVSPYTSEEVISIFEKSKFYSKYK